MLFVLDNYDSFTYNLVQYFGELGADPVVARNNEVSVADVLARCPAAVVISPGPKTPAEAGISVPLVLAAGKADIPVLGVCLGHQAIGEAYGGRIIRADRQMHGKGTDIVHGGVGLFGGIPTPMPVMRYHSLVVSNDRFPACLEVLAWSADRPPGEEIMAMRHRVHPIWGVQFHPESVATPSGRQVLQNFLVLAGVPLANPLLSK